MKELKLLLVNLFSFRGPVSEKALVGRMEGFGVTINILLHIELLIYVPHFWLVVLMHMGFFYQVNLPPWLTFCFFVCLFVFWCCIWLLYHLNIFIRICKSML